MLDNDTTLGWILAGIVGIITALTGAVTALWSRAEAGNLRREEQYEKAIAILEGHLNKCEESNQQLRIEVDRLTHRVKFLEDKK